jgi:trigger factor
MDIKRVALDAVNETIVITVVHMDYKGQVQKRINEKCLWRPLKGLERAVPKILLKTIR